MLKGPTPKRTPFAEAMTAYVLLDREAADFCTYYRAMSAEGKNTLRAMLSNQNEKQLPRDKELNAMGLKLIGAIDGQ